MKCLICNNKITEEELEFEDYYRIVRGHNVDTTDYACFDCIQNTRAENRLIHKEV